MKVILQAIKALIKKLEWQLRQTDEKLQEVNENLKGKVESQDPIMYGSLRLNPVANGLVGKNSVALGESCTASGAYSFAEGVSTNAIREGTHAEGNKTTASGEYAHAEGQGSHASELASHAEGKGTSAEGIASHAEGWATFAIGDYSHAEGRYTRAYGEFQHVQGKYNKVDMDGKYAHIVGNGINDGLGASNAHTLDWDGNAWYAGSVEGTALIVKSPGGRRFKVTVDNTGTLTTTEVTS